MFTGEEEKKENKTEEPNPKDSKKDKDKKEDTVVNEKPQKNVQEKTDHSKDVQTEQETAQPVNTQDSVPKTDGSFLYNAVATWAAPVYQAPDDKSSILRNLKKGETVQIYGDFTSSTDKSPYKIIKYKNQYGYIPYFSVDRVDLYFRCIQQPTVKTVGL